MVRLLTMVRLLPVVKRSLQLVVCFLFVKSQQMRSSSGEDGQKSAH